jgi:mannose-6-phosphate isomerase-like protein (cupin superfamily)
MDVFDLSAAAVSSWVRIDLAGATEEPPSPISYFEFHGCACGTTNVVGRPPWEHHAADELLHILDGECELTIRHPSGEEKRTLHAGDVVIAPEGCWNSNDAPQGVTMLFMTPSERSRHSRDDPASAP